jgi:4-amino-4-deoxy-L-arabinose transferase-like glycosyltransferase
MLASSVAADSPSLIRRETLTLTMGLAACLILGLVVRLLLFGGFSGSDDGSYAAIAYEMARGTFRIQEFTGAPVYPLRLAIVAPLALLFRFVGPSEAAVVAMPLLVSLLSVILAFLAGRLFISSRAGLIAAFLAALIPLDGAYGSQLIPDPLSAFWVNVSVILLFTCLTRMELRAPALVAGVAAVSFGLGWLTKEIIVYSAPFVLFLLVLLYRQGGARRRAAVVFCVTGAAVLVLECVYYHHITGDWLFRYHETERNALVSAHGLFAENSRFGWQPGHYWQAVARRVLKDGPQILLLSAPLGGITLAALFAVTYAWLRRLEALTYPAIWFLSLLLLFDFGSTSLKLYRPLVLYPEYLYPLLLPATVLSAGLLDALLPRRRPRRGSVEIERAFFAMVMLLFVLLTSLRGLYWVSFRTPESPVERVVYRRLSPRDTIYTDARTASVLRFFWKYPAESHFVNFEGMATARVPSGVHVLINRHRMDFLAGTYGVRPPEFYTTVPPHWRETWKAPGATLYWVE